MPSNVLQLPVFQWKSVAEQWMQLWVMAVLNLSSEWIVLLSFFQTAPIKWIGLLKMELWFREHWPQCYLFLTLTKRWLYEMCPSFWKIKCWPDTDSWLLFEMVRRGLNPRTLSTSHLRDVRCLWFSKRNWILFSVSILMTLIILFMSLQTLIIDLKEGERYTWGTCPERLGDLLRTVKHSKKERKFRSEFLDPFLNLYLRGSLWKWMGKAGFSTCTCMPNLSVEIVNMSVVWTFFVIMR